MAGARLAISIGNDWLRTVCTVPKTPTVVGSPDFFGQASWMDQGTWVAYQEQLLDSRTGVLEHGRSQIRAVGSTPVIAQVYEIHLGQVIGEGSLDGKATVTRVEHSYH